MCIRDRYVDRINIIRIDDVIVASNRSGGHVKGNLGLALIDESLRLRRIPARDSRDDTVSGIPDCFPVLARNPCGTDNAPTQCFCHGPGCRSPAGTWQACPFAPMLNALAPGGARAPGVYYFTAAAR